MTFRSLKPCLFKRYQ